MSEEKTITREEKRRRLIALAALAVLGLVVAGLLSWYSYSLSAPDTQLNKDFYGLGGTPPEQRQRIMAALSDGFFITGVLLASVGLLTWISSTGFFDMLSYGLRALTSLVPFKPPKKPKPFYDYKMEREEKRKKPLNSMLIVGGAYLLLAVVFTVLYYNV